MRISLHCSHFALLAFIITCYPDGSTQARFSSDDHEIDPINNSNRPQAASLFKNLGNGSRRGKQDDDDGDDNSGGNEESGGGNEGGGGGNGPGVVSAVAQGFFNFLGTQAEGLTNLILGPSTTTKKPKPKTTTTTTIKTTVPPTINIQSPSVSQQLHIQNPALSPQQTFPGQPPALGLQPVRPPAAHLIQPVFGGQRTPVFSGQPIQTGYKVNSNPPLLNGQLPVTARPGYTVQQTFGGAPPTVGLPPLAPQTPVQAAIPSGKLTSGPLSNKITPQSSSSHLSALYQHLTSMEEVDNSPSAPKLSAPSSSLIGASQNINQSSALGGNWAATSFDAHPSTATVNQQSALNATTPVTLTNVTTASTAKPSTTTPVDQSEDEDDDEDEDSDSDIDS